VKDKNKMESSSVEISIKQTIKKNGFPKKIVRLSFKSVYESCKNSGISLREVLNRLGQEDIIGEIQGDYILFRSPNKSIYPEVSNVEPPSNPFQNFQGFPDLSNLGTLGGDFLSKLNPEQKDEFRKMIANLSEEEKLKIMELAKNFKDINK
tara:strand:- start:20 stop:472 length:453 start_codon:yes stop_codon:yes gene_type:complete